MDNLQLIIEKVNQDIDPNGAPGSILAQNHNEIEQMILRQTGKYVGLPFIARGGYDNVVANGSIYFSDTMDNDLTAYVSSKTVDNTDFKPIIEMFKKFDVLHLKDFKGRSVYFYIQDIREVKDVMGNEIFELDLESFPANMNYSYLPSEGVICMIEFLTSGGNLNPSNYDLNDFKNESPNLFIRQSDLDNFQPPRPILIQSQKAVITNIGGTLFSVVIPQNNTQNGKSIWQTPDGTIRERTTNYSYTTDIDLSLNNRIDVVWVDWDGDMGHEEGDVVSVGQPTPYPSNKIPNNAMQYTFIAFINGQTSVSQNLTPEQVQEIVDNAKPKLIEMTENLTLSDAFENKYIRVSGNVILTIPTGLADSFFQCFFYIASGSLTIALQSGVTAEGYYSLVLNQQERSTLTKRNISTNQYILT